MGFFSVSSKCNPMTETDVASWAYEKKVCCKTRTTFRQFWALRSQHAIAIFSQKIKKKMSKSAKPLRGALNLSPKHFLFFFRKEAGYDRGHIFLRLKCFVNEEAPQPKIVGKKEEGHFCLLYEFSSCIYEAVGFFIRKSFYVFLFFSKTSFFLGEVLSAPELRESQKRTWCSSFVVLLFRRRKRCSILRNKNDIPPILGLRQKKKKKCRKMLP